MGARVSGMSRIPDWPLTRRTVPYLEDVFWQSGATLSPMAGDSMPPAGQTDGRLSRRLRARGAGAAQQTAAQFAVAVAVALLPAGLESARKALWQKSRRIRRVERRDAGVSRGPALRRFGTETEAAFGRKREAAIADVIVVSPEKKNGRG